MPREIDFQFNEIQEKHREAQEELKDDDLFDLYAVDRVLAKKWINKEDFYGATFQELLLLAEYPENLASDEELALYNNWRTQKNEL